METPQSFRHLLGAVILKICFLLLIPFVCSQGDLSFPLHNSPIPGEHVFLKINDLYVLYLGPVTPFLSEDNVVYVPLRGMAKLLNADEISVSYRYSAYLSRPSGYFLVEETKVTGVEIRGTTGFKTEGNTRTYDLGNHIFWLQEEEDVLVPAATLMNALGIDAYFDPGTRIFEIRDPYALRSPEFLSARYGSFLGYLSVDGVSTNAFVPESLTVEHFDGGNNRFQVQLLRLGETSGSMNVIYGFGGTYGKEARELMCAGMFCTFTFDIYSNNQDLLTLSYIVAEIKTLGKQLSTFEKE